MPWPLRYCPSCGAPLEPTSLSRQQCCACGDVHYRNAKPCAGALITRGDGSLLLARRAVEPHRGAWDVVGGFVHPDEVPAAAAAREVLEETGLAVRIGEMVGVFVDQYGETAGADYTLNVYYLAEVDDSVEPVPTSDVSELRWFAPGELPTEMAFPHERQVLDAWLEVTTIRRDRSSRA
ncbi:MAG: NUDIX hydrolase [Anaerolineae bacterium]